MLLKTANDRVMLGRCPIEALNRPQGWEIFEGDQPLSISRVKLASIEKAQDLGGFNIAEAVKEHPDHLFVKVFAIKKDEVNDNGDAFSESELIKAASTFIGVPIFCNHANDDIEKARGKVVHAWYDYDKGGIYIVSMVDKTAYPKLARGIEEGYIVGTSMGCQVAYSVCSICHNKAHVADEYCDHIKNRKTKKFSGKCKCVFKKSKCKPQENCPRCGEEPNELEHKEAIVHEDNYGLKFIEDSFVVNPACHSCLVEHILNVPEFTRKVASLQQRMVKIAAESGFDRLVKVAGKAEIDYLNKAMKCMEVVAKSMLNQKEMVSAEYVSDIVDVLASLQTATDELVEMGYGSIPSPPSLENPDNVGDAVPNPDTQQQQPQQQQPQVPQPSGAVSSPAGGIGSVTKPTFSPSAAGKMKELFKEGSKFRDKISSLSELIHRSNTADDSHWEKAAQIIEELAKEATVSNQIKESATIMENTEKTAAGVGTSESQQQVTTQKQLEEWSKKDGVLHGRTDTAPDGVTESKEQLGLSKEPVNDTSSQSPQVRQGKYPEEVIQGQFDRPIFGDGFMARWGEAPDVILEKQWTEFERSVGAILSEDQKDHTTQAQLEDLRSHHRWTEPFYTTENQLASDKNWRNTDAAWLNKEAAADYSKRLVAAAVNALSDAIVNWHRTPSELSSAARLMTKTPESHIKAAFLTLVNGIPTKKTARKAEVERARYFGKVAHGEAIDFLLACMGDHCMNLKAEDFVDAVGYVARDQNKMASIAKLAQEKANKSNEPKDEVIDKYAAFENAFNDVTNSDGMYEVGAHVSELGVPLDRNGVPTVSEQELVVASEKFAKAKFAHVDTVLYSVEYDPEKLLVVAQLKQVEKLTPEEKKIAEARSTGVEKRASNREELVKTAQMMGGEMGGQGGAAQAPGAGASLPQAPAGGAPGQPGMPGMESMEAPPEDMDGAGEGGDQQPKPPGTICPICGSEDVDVYEGKHKCNNCNTKFMTETNLVILENGYDKAQKGEGGEEMGGEEIGADQGGEEEGKGFAMPEGQEEQAPNIPVAAVAKLPPGTLLKMAENKIILGSVSPLTGSTNTADLGGGNWLCMDTGRTYNVEVKVATADPKGPLWVRWEWTPKYPKASECTSCSRTRTAWKKALAAAGLSDKDFDQMSFRKKAETILAMSDKGLFKMVKTASKNSSVTAEMKKAYSVKGKFPIESCREKLARRYGEDSLAISGPCKGEKIHDCVCKQLKNAGVYSDNIAFKIAESWKDKDACLECMEDFVRLGYDMEKAATVCNNMKVKYASDAELFGEEMGDSTPHHDDGMGGEPSGSPFGTDDGFDSHDPFSGGDEGGDGGIPVDPVAPVGGDGGGHESGLTDLPVGGDVGGGAGNVTIDIPLHVLEELDQAIGKVKGEQGGIGAGDQVDVQLPGDVANELGGVADMAVDGAESLGDIGGDLGGGPEEIEFNLGGDGGEEIKIDEEDKGGENPFEKEEGDSEGSDEHDDKGSDSEDKEPNVSENSEFKEGGEEVSDEEKELRKAESFANIMRKGKRVGQIDLNLEKLVHLLPKKADTGSAPTQELVQDSVPFTYENGKTIGNENKFDPAKPKVPEGGDKARMGVNEQHPGGDLPKVPTGNANIGHEKELGYTSDGASLTGGIGGAGKTPLASNKNNQKVAQQKKTAGETKVKPAEPVSEVIEFEFSANKDLSTTPDFLKRTPFEESDSAEIKSVPEKGEGAFMGDEKTSIEFVPKAPERQPQIPTGGGRNPKYDRNEKNAPELTTNIKGTVIAVGDEKSKRVQAEAFRIAALMLEAKLIEATGLMDQVTKLSKYDMPELKMLENTLFKSAQKGLATVQDGVEGSPVVISSDSNVRTASAELTNALKKMYRLNTQNEIAEELTDADHRNIGDPLKRNRR